MNCSVCGNNFESPVFTGKVLSKYDIDYFYCRKCGHMQTESPFWLNEAYINPINENDTGIMGRNIDFANRISPFLFCEFNKEGAYLDWAGGYGIFVRLMRDIGFDFRWTDPYSTNLFAKNADIGDMKKFELITCFEVFEHLEHPLEQFEKLLAQSDNILISTELFKSYNIPQLQDWYYYGSQHGQHISFYSIETLHFIAEKYKLNLLTNNFNLHLFSRRVIKHRLLFKFLTGAHRLLLLPFTEYVKIRMQPKTLADSKLFNK